MSISSSRVDAVLHPPLFPHIGGRLHRTTEDHRPPGPPEESERQAPPRLPAPRPICNPLAVVVAKVSVVSSLLMEMSDG